MVRAGMIKSPTSLGRWLHRMRDTLEARRPNATSMSDGSPAHQDRPFAGPSWRYADAPRSSCSARAMWRHLKARGRSSCQSRYWAERPWRWPCGSSRRGFSSRLLVAAGLVLMALGVAVGATLPDGLDAAAILPLAGAIIVLPVLRGRALLGAFALAFAASVAGEVAAHLMGGLTETSRPENLPISLAASTVLVAFAYGLVWRVSQDWLVASEQATEALNGQRQLLALNERLVETLDPQQVLT